MSYLEEHINTIINADCLDILKQLPDKCIDLVLTDPPYGYLNCKFDKEYFDEESTFFHLKRILKKDGLICFSGRGDSFYRWNILLEDLPFKEEIIWNKNLNSNPAGVLKRIHETISIRGFGKINLVKINFIEENIFNNTEFRILQTIKRIKSEIPKHKKEFLDYIETGHINYEREKKQGFGITSSKGLKEINRGVGDFKKICEGTTMKSILSTSHDEYYSSIHPTQKPVYLWEKLIELCSKEGDLILDCFSGSGTTAVACHNLKRNFICIEKDFDYWKASCKRLEEHKRQLTLF